MNWLQGIKEREKKAKEGPWDVFQYLLQPKSIYRDQEYGFEVRHTESDEYENTYTIANCCSDDHRDTSKQWRKNTSFIAHARTDIPDLLKFIAEALPVMEWAADDKCFKSGNRRTIKRCDCPTCKARAWIAKYGKEL